MSTPPQNANTPKGHVDLLVAPKNSSHIGDQIINDAQAATGGFSRTCKPSERVASSVRWGKGYWFLGLTLASLAHAGGSAPRPLLPDFVQPTSPVDCEVASRTDGCRLRVALPIVLNLRPGQWRALSGPDQLTVIYRASGLPKALSVCCGLQLPMSPVRGTDLWGVTARVRDVQRAVIDLGVVVDGQFPQKLQSWRGENAPPAIQTLSPDKLQGQMHEFTLDSGSKLTGTRRISVYTPPGWTAQETLPAVYLADGAALSMAQVLEPAIRAGTAPRVVLVGIESATSSSTEPHKDLRALEYLNGFENGQMYFEAHETFVLKIVIPYIEHDFHVLASPQGRVVGGFSNGAVWAISMAARHSELFRGVIALSPGWQPAIQIPDTQTRVFTSGGTLEPGFLRTATEYATLIKASGGTVRLVKRVSGHDQIVWQEEFPGAVRFVLDQQK